MQKLSVDFENCYGIKKLEHSFDFSTGCAHVIYAQNGAMKSSFAKIFDDISKKETPKDRVFIDRNSKSIITCNEEEEVDGSRVFVVERYKENFRSDKLTTLLVNQDLKTKYIDILSLINEKKDNLIKLIASKSGIRATTFIAEFTKTFNMGENDVLACFQLLESIVSDENSLLGFEEIKFNSIFNDKVLTFLNAKDVKIKLAEYMNVYDRLITTSKYFKKGIFNHNNADTVSKSLKSNGFFDAKHSVSLNNGDERKELNSQEELEEEINIEKTKILNDDELSKKFKSIDDLVYKTGELREFRSFLESNLSILTEISDLNSFKRKLWCSYIRFYKTEYVELLELYKIGKSEIEIIVDQAKKEETSWKKVVDIFNGRFSVPYRIVVKNQDDVILKESSPNIVFEYYEGIETKEIGGKQLIDILSTGEQRALYILNIIFEIEIRKTYHLRTLLIVDDIADSFDYKNKYAIIEYLKDILDCDKFRVIILTHNFDFYRTILGRLEINPWLNNHVAIKNKTKVSLVCGRDKLDVFKRLKTGYHDSDILLIACIPFVRNLIEYTESKQSEHYRTLTSLLHIKQRKTKDSVIIKSSLEIVVKDLEEIYNQLFKLEKKVKNSDRQVLKVIMDLCEKLSKETEETMNIENKLVLSIGIRLQAEAYMIFMINDSDLITSIEKNQTPKLLKHYKEKFNQEKHIIGLLEQVTLMTSENIHLNSFMYEPLLDLSDHHLKDLYIKIKSLVVPDFVN